MRYLAAVLLLGILGALAVQWRNAARTVERIDEIRSVTDKLTDEAPHHNEEVLKLCASMSSNQDALVAAMKTAAALLDRAETLAHGPGIVSDAEFDRAFALARSSMKEKGDLSDLLRSDWALLRNSLGYLVDLEHNGGNPEFARAGLSDTLNDLVLCALVFERSRGADAGARIRAGLKR